MFDVTSIERDWPHRVERILREAGHPEVEVINAGIPGHASFDSFGRLFAEGHVLDPDYVVLYNAWNDIKYFRWTDPLLRSMRPFVDSMDPRLNYQNPVDKLLCEISQVYVRLRYRYYSWRLDDGPEGRRPHDEYVSEIGEIGPKQYRVNTEMFVDLARNIGAVPILMTQARLVSENNTPAQKERIVYEYQGLTHEALCDAFAVCDEITNSVARAKRVHVIDASGLFSGRDDLFNDHVHLTDEGSQSIAQFAAQHILKLLKSRQSTFRAKT